MNKINLTYKTNLLAQEKEQASGFPPFTEGYHTTYKELQLVTEVPDNCLSFSFTENSVVQIFEALQTTELSSVINLKCRFSDKVNQLAYIPILRTLLCLYLQKKNKNFDQIQFVFYAENGAPSLLCFQLAQAIGINYFCVKNIEQTTIIKKHINSHLTNPLYGNGLLKTEIETLFFNLKQKLDRFFF